MKKSKDEMTILTGRVLGGEIAPDVIVEIGRAHV